MMSRCEYSRSGIFGHAGFCLPVCGCNYTEANLADLSLYDYIPFISQIKVTDLDAASLFKKLNYPPPAVYWETTPAGSDSGYSLIAAKSACIIIDAPNNYANNSVLRDFLASMRVPSLDFPFFSGGLIGFWSYEFGLDMFNITAKKTDIPKQYFFMPEEVIVLDKNSQLLTSIIWVNTASLNTAAFSAVSERLKAIEQLALSLPAENLLTRPDNRLAENTDFIVNIPDYKFSLLVEKVQEHIKRGQVSQVVLSRCWEKTSQADPFTVFQSLCQLNPSPYMFYIDMPDFTLLGASPESQVQVKGDKVVVSPIAGTKKLCGDRYLDLQTAQELLSDDKELGEHIMLVDLSRDELSKVSKKGSVTVEEMFRLSYFSHVVHLVSKVKGNLEVNADFMDAFAACFPAGTLSGAPKQKAMQLINELEPRARGVYGGSIGCLSFNGNLDSCIIIRTALYQNGVYHIQSGAGIVADSMPRNECKETYIKAQALLTAISWAESQG